MAGNNRAGNNTAGNNTAGNNIVRPGGPRSTRPKILLGLEPPSAPHRGARAQGRGSGADDAMRHRVHAVPVVFASLTDVMRYAFACCGYPARTLSMDLGPGRVWEAVEESRRCPACAHVLTRVPAEIGRQPTYGGRRSAAGSIAVFTEAPGSSPQ